MKIGKREKLVLIGDSITDCGRAQPVAEGLFDPLGRGYVTMIESLLTSTYPERGIRVINVGSSGHTVRELKDRWDRDVIALKPDWLSINIGINDVWRQFDLPRQTQVHVNLEEYANTLEALVAKTRPMVKGLVLMTPHYIEPNRKDAMRARMDQYGGVVKRLAKAYDAVLVDTQAAFDAMLKHVHPNALAWDRVHPNQAGHMILARAFLKAVGYSW
jgi:lysophospholipase L1-like esterase